MTGYIRVKNGIWQMCFSWKDHTGKWCKKEISTRLKEKGNKRRAEAMMKEKLAEMEKQSIETTMKESTLFLEEMEHWLDEIMVYEVRPHTLHQYKYVFRSRISAYPPFQGLRIKDITPRVLQGFIIHEQKQGLSPSSIKKHFVNIHKFLKYLWQMDEIQTNPADRVKLPKSDRSQKGSVYSPEELQRLLSLFEEDPLHLFVLIAATYGMRRSEICGLKWDAVDLDAGYLYVKATAIVDCGEVVYSDQTKSRSSRRRLPLSQMVLAALRKEHLQQRKNRLAYGPAYQNHQLVCCWPDGSPLRPDYVTYHYKRIIQKSDLRFVNLKNLRDTAATVLHNNGFDVKCIQGLLGHADVSTTANIYVHFDNLDMSPMANAMDNILRKKA